MNNAQSQYTIREFISDIPEELLQTTEDNKMNKKTLKTIIDNLIKKSRSSPKTRELVEFAKLINSGHDRVNSVSLLLEEINLAHQRGILETYLNRPFTQNKFQDIESQKYTIIQFISDLTKEPDGFNEIFKILKFPCNEEVAQKFDVLIKEVAQTFDVLIKESESFAKIRMLKAFLKLTDLDVTTFPQKVTAITLLQDELNIARKRNTLYQYLNQSFTLLPFEEITCEAIISFAMLNDDPYTGLDGDGTYPKEHKILTREQFLNYIARLSQHLNEALTQHQKDLASVVSNSPHSPTISDFRAQSSLNQSFSGQLKR